MRPYSTGRPVLIRVLSATTTTPQALPSRLFRVFLDPKTNQRRERERENLCRKLSSHTLPKPHQTSRGGALVAEGSRTPLMPCRRRRERLRVWDRPRFGDVGMCGEVRQVPVGEGGELRKVRFGCGVEARIGVERRHLHTHTHTYIHTHTHRGTCRCRWTFVQLVVGQAPKLLLAPDCRKSISTSKVTVRQRIRTQLDETEC